MIHLRSIARTHADPESDRFPFSVPAIRAIRQLEFTTAVTVLVGENGSGKSTLLEALAASVHLPAVGSAEVQRDQTLAQQRELARVFTCRWNKRTTRGFFLRAEDFFGFTRELRRMREAFQRELEQVATDFADASPYARGLREGPVRASLAEMERRYGVDLDANSHGQSFLVLFRSRLVPGGLYLLDEPEAPLSPQGQLALLAMIRELEAQDAQFIIATHSPILLAYPGATIYSFDESPPASVAWDTLPHVALTRDFLRDPARYLRHLDP